MICLETSVLVDFLRKDTSIVSFIEEWENVTEVATTAICIYELYYGAFKSRKKDKNIEALEKLEASMEIFHFDAPAAKKAGEVFQIMESRGETVDLRDVFIASIAIVHEVLIATKNEAHFSRMQEFGLELVVP
ncbi:MAG TPA: type II toxin-antitoxin system VapC family toxin [Candidatus Lokiarchaeia archaeon]|nr:type II toxin-antitoxin system VapC family toxin [Candidatus Lokiarchaeia archaeon]